jgi:hypothetical protein
MADKPNLSESLSQLKADAIAYFGTKGACKPSRKLWWSVDGESCCAVTGACLQNGLPLPANQTIYAKYRDWVYAIYEIPQVVFDAFLEGFDDAVKRAPRHSNEWYAGFVAGQETAEALGLHFEGDSE